MEAARWRRLEEVFSDASDLPAAERSAYLDQACDGDPDLRTEVEALLAEAPTATAQLSDAIGYEARLFASQDQTGRRIGAYRIADELGHGGMGAVYLAWRDDDQYHTKVAIKVLLRGLETSQAVSRFRDERQILATLEHPGIVRLLDGGSTEDQLPYLVMEHVEGVPIDQFVVEHRLSIRQRVELFRKVCAAVQYAHQRLVVHRDLKPSNILVKADGTPKLLDFGIAKLLDTEVGRAAHTGTGVRPLTPDYASPEQVRGEPASAASDVYALGLVLFELLTGKKGQHIEGAALSEMERLLQKPVARPSTVASDGDRRALAGDLDNIVLHAVEKDIAQRYASVEQLATDLDNYLEGRPILARTGTVMYRAGKFVRRNRLAVGAAAAVALALSTATAVSLVQARRADRQAQRADEQARRAERRFQDVRRLAHSLLFEVDDQIRQLDGATAARQLIVTRAREYLDGLAREADQDPALSRELAAAYIKLGDIQGSSFMPSLGNAVEALASHAKAQGILERLIQSGHDDAATRQELAHAHYAISGAASTNNDIPAMREHAQAAVRLIETLPRDGGFDYDMAIRSYVGLGQAERLSGDTAAGERAISTSITMAEAQVAKRPSSESSYLLSTARSARGAVRGGQGAPQKATEDLLAARQMLEAIAGEHPQNIAYRRELFYVGLLLGGMLGGIGEWPRWMANTNDVAGAERELAAAARIAEGVAGADPHDARASCDAAWALTAHGAVVAGRDPHLALPILERARSRFEALPPAMRATIGQNEWFTLCTLAEALARLGRRSDALREAGRGLRMVRAALPPKGATVYDRVTLAVGLVYVARMHRTLGDDRAALPLLDEAHGELTALAHGPGASDIQVLNGLTEVLTLLADIRRDQRCALLEEAQTTWSSWKIPTAYTRGRAAEIERSRTSCRADK